MSTQKLISEQLPTDGSYQMTHLLKEVNEWLKQNGKHGKTAKLKAIGQSLALQFSFQGKQVNKGIGERITKEGLEKGKRIALLVSNQLELGTFTEEWLNELLGKTSKQAIEEKPKEKTCKELLAEYKAYWTKERKGLKSDVNKAWFDRQRWLDTLEAIDKPLTDKVIQDVILSSKPNSSTRASCIQAVKSFLDFHCQTHPKFIDKLAKDNKPEKAKKYIPTDPEIEYCLKQLIANEDERVGKQGFRQGDLIARQKLTFVYKLLAIYGLRIHEAFKIANWDKPVTFKNGDWVTVETGDNEENDDSDTMEQYQGEDWTLPAITDPNNTDKILAIKHDTKTGYRMAMPLSPLTKDWIKDWSLIQDCPIEELLPNWKTTNKTRASTLNRYFMYGKLIKPDAPEKNIDRFIPFTPHALRHAYNHRGHSQGINPSQLAQSLGHSLQMNTSTYFRTMREATKLQGLKKAFSRELNKVDEVTALKEEIERLKTENNRLQEENERLKAIINLEKALKAE